MDPEISVSRHGLIHMYVRLILLPSKAYCVSAESALLINSLSHPINTNNSCVSDYSNILLKAPTQNIRPGFTCL